MEVVNCVISGDLNTEIDYTDFQNSIENNDNCNIKTVEEVPKRGISVELNEEEITIFNSGSYIIRRNSIPQAKKSDNKFKREVRKIIGENKIPSNIVNVVCTHQLEREEVDLYKLAITHLNKINYETEQFPAAIIPVEKDNHEYNVNLHSGGKIIITGATEPYHLDYAIEYVNGLIDKMEEYSNTY